MYGRIQVPYRVRIVHAFLAGSKCSSLGYTCTMGPPYPCCAATLPTIPAMQFMWMWYKALCRDTICWAWPGPRREPQPSLACIPDMHVWKGSVLLACYTPWHAVMGAGDLKPLIMHCVLSAVSRPSVRVRPSSHAFTTNHGVWSDSSAIPRIVCLCPCIGVGCMAQLVLHPRRQSSRQSHAHLACHRHR